MYFKLSSWKPSLYFLHFNKTKRSCENICWWNWYCSFRKKFYPLWHQGPSAHKRKLFLMHFPYCAVWIHPKWEIAAFEIGHLSLFCTVYTITKLFLLLPILFMNDILHWKLSKPDIVWVASIQQVAGYHSAICTSLWPQHHICNAIIQ